MIYPSIYGLKIRASSEEIVQVDWSQKKIVSLSWVDKVEIILFVIQNNELGN